MAFDAPSVAFGELVFGEGCEEAGGRPASASARLAKLFQSWLIVGRRRSASIRESLMASTLLGIGCREVVAAGHDAPPAPSRDP